MKEPDRMVIPAETTVAILAMLVGLLTLNYLPVGGFYDDGLYVILAKALATGHGYRFLNLPGAPAAVHYPPGYPLLLALLWKLGPEFPENLIWFKLLNVVLLGAIAWTTCRYAVRVLAVTPGIAVLGTLIGTLTIPLLTLVAMVLSEPLFLALLIPALILAEEMARGRPGRREAIWLGLLTAAVMLVRGIGVMLPVAVIAVWLARRHARAVAWYLAVVVVAYAPWLLWTARHAHDVAPALQGAYGGYAAWFMGGLRDGGLPFVLATARTNVHALAAGIATSFQFGPAAALAWGTMAVVGLLLAYGAWRVRRRAPVTLIFLALYLGLVAVWPDQPLRFAWGVWPLLMALLLVPLEVLQAPDTPRSLRWAVALAALALVPGILRYNALGYAHDWWESIPRAMTARAQPAIRWTRVHTRRTDVVAGESEPMLYLYAEREALPVATFTAQQYLRDPADGQNAGYLRQIVQAGGARYVLVQSPGALAAASALAADTTARPRLTPVDSTGGLYVFAVGDAPRPPVPAPAAPADSAAR